MNNPITQSTNETCNIVQDLLPLYYDDVCSPSSKRLVEKHLKTCEKCQNTYNELKNDSIDSMIKKEADSVLKHDITVRDRPNDRFGNYGHSP